MSKLSESMLFQSLSKKKSCFLLLFSHEFKKSLKIPKGYSESVYQRRTDNTMAKRKTTKHTHKIKDRVLVPLVAPVVLIYLQTSHDFYMKTNHANTYLHHLQPHDQIHDFS